MTPATHSKDVIEDSPASVAGEPTIATEACQAAKQDQYGHAVLDVGLEAIEQPNTDSGNSTAAIENSQARRSRLYVGYPASWLRKMKATVFRATTPAAAEAASAQMPSPPAAAEVPPPEGNPAHPKEAPIVVVPPIFDENAFVQHRLRFGHRGNPPLSMMLDGWDRQVKRAVRKELAREKSKHTAGTERERAAALLQEAAV